MLGTSVSAFVATASRNPAGVAAVRAATDWLGHPVELVLIEATRSIAIATMGSSILQPRPPRPAETALLSGAREARVDGSTAVAVALTTDHVVALSVPAEIDDAAHAHLADAAAQLPEAFTASADTAPTATADAAKILAGLRDTVIILDANLDVSWSNEAIVTLLGWTPSEVVGRSSLELIHPDDVGFAVDAAARLHDANRVYRIKLRLKTAAGEWLPVSITGLDHSENPDIGGLVLSLRNDQQELENAEALQRSRRVSSAILQNLNEAVIATDEVGVITIANTAARTLFSINDQLPAVSLSLDDIVLYDIAGERVSTTDHPLRADAGVTNRELRVHTSTGERHVTVSCRQVSSDQDHLGVVVTFHDITQAHSDAEKLRNRALHDQLTGLANRRFLSERLQAIAEAGTSPRIAACFVDIDKFKNVNDIHGHRIGDAVLQATAERLRSYIRGDDILARPGGDEFLVILVAPESEQIARDVAERIRVAMSEPFEIEGNRLHLTASVGIAMQDGGVLDDERLLQNADIALYAAKDRGRDRIEIFDQKLAVVVEREQRQRNMVRDALDNNRLLMYFQPIVDSAGTTIGVEALARILDDTGQIIEPSGFLPAIEGTSLMVRLDHAGFERSCAIAAQLATQAETRHIWVAANFSAMTLAQSDFADLVLSAIERAGVSPTSICIEVTETAAFEAGDTTIQALARLNELGVRVALDDFGTGYSSLSHLRDLPLSTVKIDRSFTSQLNHHGAERAIATAVRDLARSLGFSVVAEGVETEADQQAVHDLGVTSMQGWYFAKALPANEFLQSVQPVAIDTSAVSTTTSEDH